MTPENEKREIELKAQVEVISAYISQIGIRNWTIAQVRESLSLDLEYLEKEFGILQTLKILNP